MSLKFRLARLPKLHFPFRLDLIQKMQRGEIFSRCDHMKRQYDAKINMYKSLGNHAPMVYTDERLV